MSLWSVGTGIVNQSVHPSYPFSSSQSDRITHMNSLPLMLRLTPLSLAPLEIDGKQYAAAAVGSRLVWETGAKLS